MLDTLKNSIINTFVTVAVFLLGLFLFARFGSGVPLSVVNTNRNDFFTVTADGKVTAIPDVAEVSLGFTSTSNTVAQAQNQANQTINKISAAVKNLGIKDDDIKTTNYNLRPDYDFNARPQRITGYTIDVNLRVKVRDFAKINQVIDAGTTNGANLVGNLNFTFDDVEKYRSQARKIAIDNGKKKASEIAGTAGINLGRLVNVYESYNDFARPMITKEMSGIGGAAPAPAPTQIEPGSSEVSISVTLNYETR